MTTPSEEGTPDRPLIVLAEAPGRTEMRMRQPLVGPSGYVFKDCLHAAGIIRRDCYILNVWPFEVYKDKTGNITYQGRCLWDKNGLTEDGLDAADDTLQKIRSASASTILTFGQQACALATGIHNRISKWRGSILSGTADVSHKKVVPTFHPAATLHGTYLWRYNIIADMRRAWEESRSPELRLPQRKFRLKPSAEEAVAFLNECRRAGRVATDLEIINHQVSCFSLCHDPFDIMCVALTEEGRNIYTAEEEIAIWQAYAGILEDEAVVKINQNLVGFDVPFLAQKNRIYAKGPMYDTMVAQNILYPDFPKGLDFIASVHTREPYYKDDGKLWKNPTAAGAKDYETFWRYCCRDSAVAMEAWDVLAAEMTAGGYWDTYNRTVALARPLVYMTVTGLRVDEESLNRTRIDVGEKLLDLEKRLEAIAPGLNPSSPKQCNTYFYETKGCQVYVNKDGRPTTDDKALSRIYRRYHLPEAKLIQEIRATAKLKNTYLEVSLDEDHRIRCSWNPRGTWTGRLSSSQTIFGTGMNLQNLAPEFNSFIVAEPEADV